jgi:hypothetical protein
MRWRLRDQYHTGPGRRTFEYGGASETVEVDRWGYFETDCRSIPLGIFAKAVDKAPWWRRLWSHEK